MAAAAVSTGAFAQFTCSFPAVAPNGSFTISCANSTTPPPPSGTTSGGAFTLAGPTTLTTGTTGSYSVTRAGAVTGGYTATVTVSTPATCSVSAGGSFTFADGASAGSGSATVSALAAGTCTVNLNLSAPSGTTPTNAATTAGTPLNVTISSGSSPPPPPPPAAGCPAVPSNYVDVSPYPTSSGPATTIRQASGVIGGFPLPHTNSGHNSGSMWITDNVVSPSGSFGIDVMITPCKGFIPSTAAEIATAGACYYHSNVASYNEVKWAGRNSAGYPNSVLDGAGFCPAMESSGTYYFNFRYTYQACNYGTCGEVFTWYDSYY